MRPLVRKTPETRIATLQHRVDALERRQIGYAAYEIKVFADDRAITTGNSKFVFAIPRDVSNSFLRIAQAFVSTVSSSGLVTVQIRNITNGNSDMLSTRITIDVGEFTSITATTPAVIDDAANQVSYGDLIAIDVDVAGTGAMGLGVILQFGTQIG